MTDFFWPGDDRAGDHFTGGQLLAAMLAVEESWLGVLVDGGVAPEAARSHLQVRHEHVEWIEDQAELAGNPVPALLDLLREDPDLGPETQHWLHRGLTSQDVLDTALMWCLGRRGRGGGRRPQAAGRVARRPGAGPTAGRPPWPAPSPSTPSPRRSA